MCCISQNTLENVHSGSKEVQLKPSQIKSIKGVCGELHKVLGEIEMTVRVSKLKLPGSFIVCEKLHHSLLERNKPNNVHLSNHVMQL